MSRIPLSWSGQLLPHDLETALDYRFKDQALLRAALTHASSQSRPDRRRPREAATQNNQRLEFLGDRVLALIMAERLLDHYPKASEGALTSRSQVLVSTVTLAEVAAELQLDRWLVTDGSVPAGGVRLSRKMQADACEALIGALFCDGGLDAARAFIVRFWQRRIKAMAEPPRDPKMALQEWALERALPLPVYTVQATVGPPHAPIFKIQAEVEGQAPVVAEGSSKRRAEQAAATLLMTAINHHG